MHHPAVGFAKTVLQGLPLTGSSPGDAVFTLDDQGLPVLREVAPPVSFVAGAGRPRQTGRR